jgi:cell division septum initiation protein DivIVA
MRSMPGMSATYSISVAKSAISPSRRHRAAVGVDVLAEQRHFAHALVGEAGHFGQHVVERARHFLAARVGHHAVAAVLRAAFHDRHERARAFHARGRQVVELLDLGERDVDLRAAAAARVDHLRQAVQVCGPNTRSTYGARDTIDAPSWLATQPPTPISRPGFASFSSRTRPRSENTFSCAFAHRAGVEQDDVRVFGRVGLLEAFGRIQHVHHLVRVVLVHLAAEGLYVNFLGHGVRRSQWLTWGRRQG